MTPPPTGEFQAWPTRSSGTLGLCSQLELDLAVEKAAARKARNAPHEPKGASLRPASEAVKAEEKEEDAPQMKYDPASVFASFQRVRGTDKPTDKDKDKDKT